MKLFVFGATGFIGNYVVNRALEKGHEVLALVRPRTFNKFENRHNIKIISSEILDINYKSLEGCDAIINLAASGVSPQISTWEEMFKINVEAPFKIANIANKINIKRIVCAGTFHEYGDSAKNYEKIPPNAPLKPTSPYGITKALSFQLLNQFAIHKKLELVYPRIFSAYGMGQNLKNFWPSLREAALNNKDFNMTSGKQIRDFIKVEKVAEHLINACERKDIQIGNPLVINIGSGKGLSLIDFARSQWNLFNATGNLIPGAIKDRDNPDRFIADITRLNE